MSDNLQRIELTVPVRIWVDGTPEDVSKVLARFDWVTFDFTPNNMWDERAPGFEGMAADVDKATAEYIEYADADGEPGILVSRGPSVEFDKREGSRGGFS